jgi:hypothetical protein
MISLPLLEDEPDDRQKPARGLRRARWRLITLGAAVLLVVVPALLLSRPQRPMWGARIIETSLSFKDPRASAYPVGWSTTPGIRKNPGFLFRPDDHDITWLPDGAIVPVRIDRVRIGDLVYTIQHREVWRWRELTNLTDRRTLMTIIAHRKLSHLMSRTRRVMPPATGK